MATPTHVPGVVLQAPFPEETGPKSHTVVQRSIERQKRSRQPWKQVCAGTKTDDEVDRTL